MKQVMRIKAAANQCLLSTEIGLKDRLSTDIERLKMECLTFLGETAINATRIEEYKKQGFYINAVPIYKKTFIIYRLEVAVYVGSFLGYVATCMERVEHTPTRFSYSFLAMQPAEITDNNELNSGAGIYYFDTQAEALKAGITLVTAILSGDINLIENGN